MFHINCLLSLLYTVIFCTADQHRVQLKGVLPDYIHATFVNVRFPNCSSLNYMCIIIVNFVYKFQGLQAQKSIHCGSESHGEHHKGFLDDGPGERLPGCGDALWSERNGQSLGDVARSYFGQWTRVASYPAFTDSGKNTWFQPFAHA